MTASVQITNPTGRKTEARVVTIGSNEYFFSYETCIAFRGVSGGREYSIRLPNSWGPTTGKHFNEMGCKNFEVIEQTSFFNAIVDRTTETVGR
jgi:hypothetical protein